MFSSKVDQQSIFFFFDKKSKLRRPQVMQLSFSQRDTQSVNYIQLVKSQLSSNYNSRHKIKILSTNNLTIIKCCMININYRFKPLFFIKLCHFQKFIQIIDFFFRRKIGNVVIIIKSNFMFFKIYVYNKIFIFSDTNKRFQY